MSQASLPHETTATGISQAEVNASAWKAADTFCAGGDLENGQNYILALLFLRYLSENWKNRLAQYRQELHGDEERLRRRMSRERFILPDGCDFDAIHAKRNEPNLGETINSALDKIEEANKAKLDGLFHNIDFNTESLGDTKARNHRLKRLIEDFAGLRLDPHPSGAGDAAGDTCRHLIKQFSGISGKHGGNFYTPDEVSDLLARLLNPQKGARICDPACGSGSLLLRVADEVGDRDLALYGQEADGATWALCRMNLFMHGKDSARIERGDTLGNPKLLDKDALQRFDIVVAHPPFSLDGWGAEAAAKDRFGRFHRGVPPKGKADYAFITHMIETAAPNTGKAGVIVPHGALFRGGAEGRIRQRLIEENLLDCVIGLPPNLFHGTSVLAAILLFQRGRNTSDVLFIDASRDCEESRNLSKLRSRDIETIVATYKKFETVEKYSRRATLEEIRENDFNLSISRYVNAFEQEEEIDIRSAREEIEELEAELTRVRDEMRKHLEELAL